jgi:DNA-directed RNA polymerase alpha subunit
MAKTALLKGRRPSHGTRRHDRVTKLAEQLKISPQQARERLRKPRPAPAKEVVSPEAAIAALLALPIEELHLSVRAYNALKHNEIYSIGALVNKTGEWLMEYLRNFGIKSLNEVRGKLSNLPHPLYLKGDTPESVAAALASH